MVAKDDGSAARAKRPDAKRPDTKHERTTLKSVDGDAAMPISLDRVIHERLRLAIVSALAVHESLTFNELKAMLETSDGNVSVHARKLEDAGYVACKKGFDGRVPRTEYKLTAAGRRALEQYLAHMEALIKRVSGV
jgi:DNA-binding transcriptional ArsR family regulator